MNGPPAEPRQRQGEFELIESVFAPLARGCPGAFGLADDVAVLSPLPGHDIVLKTDSLVESVHFHRGDPASTVGRKALRRALSDLAAKGAQPAIYLLALALPPWPDAQWLQEFADGLAGDQEEFGICLAGGETNATPGPVTITITAIGQAPEGATIRRIGAQPGDIVYVTGAIGDAGGGLSIAARSHPRAQNAAESYLLARYHLPLPRLSFGIALRGLASAALDVSDGLIADLEHIAEASHVGMMIDSAAMPLSAELLQVSGDSLDARIRAATAGDDYEIAFTADPSAAQAIQKIAERTGTAVTAIGRVLRGEGVSLREASGNQVVVQRKGYTHFRT